MTEPSFDWIERCDDPEKLRVFIDRARAQERTDLETRAFRRLSTIAPSKTDDPLDREFHSVVEAYEELLRQKHGRKQPAARTWQKYKNKGAEQCLIDWALSEQPTEGFYQLIKAGLADLSGEALLLKYRARFQPNVVEAAKARLRDHGINPEQFCEHRHG